MKISILKIMDFNLINVDILIEYISKDKKEKIMRFLKKEDKVRGILGELLIRKMLTDEFNIKNKEIIFNINEYNKPYLRGGEDIHFNISHSGEYVICALDSKAIGIDIEKIENSEIDEIVKGFFSIKEQEYILGKNEDYTIEEKNNRFFQIWTLKESFVKCIGKGLSMPFNKFTIYFDKRNKVVVDYKLVNNRYIFKEFQMQGYKLSVCSKGNEITDNITFITIKDLEASFI